MLGVATRWSLRAWITPYVDASLWVYGASVLYEWARSCGLGVLAGLALLILGRRLRRQRGLDRMGEVGSGCLLVGCVPDL